MRHINTFLLAFLFVFILSATLAVAHHSFNAEFDPAKPVTLEGEVVEFQWKNPHSWLILKVKTKDGKEEIWNLEAGAPSPLLRLGWTKDTVKAGMRVKVSAFRARDGQNRAAGNMLEFPDGPALKMGDTPKEQNATP